MSEKIASQLKDRWATIEANGG